MKAAFTIPMKKSERIRFLIKNQTRSDFSSTKILSYQPFSIF
ncbi:hypothetical protein BMWSH_4789 [Priestia megaterium WSH-002]|uniref:Uncharacterized protein n=1 Tax=Priestia megaterium (strain WSH-002) TaxID=1006007 RepID=A0A8D3X5U5_PRIMW|nr:hypothetical protein BMWSH_4789 [Priestia megaterium WSH-002]